MVDGSSLLYFSYMLATFNLKYTEENQVKISPYFKYASIEIIFQFVLQEKHF